MNLRLTDLLVMIRSEEDVCVLISSKMRKIRNFTSTFNGATFAIAESEMNNHKIKMKNFWQNFRMCSNHRTMVKLEFHVSFHNFMNTKEKFFMFHIFCFFVRLLEKQRRIVICKVNVTC